MGKKDVVEVKDALDAPAHSLAFEEVLKQLTSDPQSGLTEAEAERRTTEYGENALEEGGGVQPLQILIHQVANALTLVSPMALKQEHKIGRQDE